MALIGVMATGLVVVVNPLVQIQKAQDSKRKSDLSQIQKALETYYQDNGKYPSSNNSTPLHRIKRLDGTTADWGQEFQPYMSILPKDPSSPSKNYIYHSVSTDGQTYYLYTNLDRGGNDPQACFSNGNPCSSAVNNGVATQCGGNCNYGVSSQNVSP